MTEEGRGEFGIDSGEAEGWARRERERDGAGAGAGGGAGEGEGEGGGERRRFFEGGAREEESEEEEVESAEESVDGDGRFDLCERGGLVKYPGSRKHSCSRRYKRKLCGLVAKACHSLFPLSLSLSHL